MELHANHEQLPVIGQTNLPAQPDPVQLVTFLNRTLKRRGLIFGLRQLADGNYRLVVYDSGPISPQAETRPEGQVDPEG